MMSIPRSSVACAAIWSRSTTPPSPRTRPFWARRWAPHTDGERFQRLAVAAATARAKWVAEASAMADAGTTLSEAQVARLGHLRTAYEELSAVYEATRRMVERGYVTYRPIQG
jgi:hypothetical protein